MAEAKKKGTTKKGNGLSSPLNDGLENPCPVGWESCLLGDIAETTSGGTPDRKSPKYYEGTIPWVKSGELNDRYIDSAEETITETGLKGSSAKLFPSGTLLMAMYGATVGKTAVLRIQAATNQAVCGIFPDTRKALPEFLRYFLIEERHELLKRRYGGAQPNISQNVIRNFPLRLPPLPEQRAIASILGQVQKAIEEQEKILALTAELKRTLLHQLFTRGLRNEPQKQTDIGPIPKSWEVVLLHDCATVQTGVAKGRRFTGKDTIELPYLRVANVQAGYLDLSEIKTITIQTKERKRFELQKGDIVLTEGGDFDKLGRGFIWQGEIENCVHQNHIFAVRVDQKRLLPNFFAYQSQSPYGKAYFLSVAHKTTNLACINTTKLRGFPVLVPTLEEQKEMVDTFRAVDARWNLQQRKHATLSDLFRTLLHQLMTGR